VIDNVWQNVVKLANLSKNNALTKGIILPLFKILKNNEIFLLTMHFF